MIELTTKDKRTLLIVAGMLMADVSSKPHIAEIAGEMMQLALKVNQEQQETEQC